MIRNLFLSGLVVACLAGSPAYAARTIFIPPLHQDTVHGGIVSGQVCYTADMLAPITYGNSGTTDAGVQSTNHSFKISFQNLSATPQNISISLMPGTKVTGRNSRGGANGVPDTDNPTRSLSSPLTGNITLGPLSDGSYDITFGTNSTASAIYPFDSTSVICAGPQQTCSSQQSTLILKIEIAEDRGAVQANITSTAHRCAGHVDHYLQPPLMYQINGGRPF